MVVGSLLYAHTYITQQKSTQAKGRGKVDDDKGSLLWALHSPKLKKSKEKILFKK